MDEERFGPVRVPPREEARAQEPHGRRAPRFRDYTDAECLAIRMIQTCRAEAERPLSARERRSVAHAIDVMAEHGDMQAQVDAAALA